MIVLNFNHSWGKDTPCLSEQFSSFW
jgi:hypothetical protein